MSQKRLLWHYLVILGVTAVVALLFRTFLIETYRIPSDVMRPALIRGDVILVAKWTFGIRWPGMDGTLTRGRAPNYGEIVVFQPPEDPGRSYLKRVVGLPGDTVEIKDGRLLWNGESLPFITDEATSQTPAVGCGIERHPKADYRVCYEPGAELEPMAPRKITDGYVFLIGDRRAKDSSRIDYGSFSIRSVYGKPLAVILSVDPATSRTRADRWWVPVQ